MEIKVGQTWQFSIDNRYGVGELVERIIDIEGDYVDCKVIRCDVRGWYVGQCTRYYIKEFIDDIESTNGKLVYDFNDYLCKI